MAIRLSGNVIIDDNRNITSVRYVQETVFSIVDGNADLNPANGTIQLWTLGANRTPTANNFPSGTSLTLYVNDGSGFTINWTSIGVSWVNGIAPTLSLTQLTVISLWKIDSTVYGAAVGDVA